MSLRSVLMCSMVAVVLPAGVAPPAVAAPASPYIFSRPAFVTLGSPHDMTLGDLNADGRLDIVTSVGFRSNPSTFGVSVQLARATSGYTPAVRYQTGERVDGVHIIDLDADGHLDVVTERYAGGTEDDPADRLDQAVVMRGNGAGELGESIDLATDPFKDLAVGSFDGGGTADLAVATDDGLTIYRQDTPFGFAPSGPIATGPFASVAAIDVDGDGIDEVAAATQGGAVELYRGTQRIARTVLAGTPTLEVADADADAAPEILASTDSRTWVLDGDLRELRRVTSPALVLDAATGDLDGDDLPDIVVTNETASASVFFGRGGPAKPILLVDAAQAVAVSDATGDGHDDILAMEAIGSIVEVVDGDGVGSFPAPRPKFSTDPGAWDVATGDFNEDGKVDMMTAQWEPYFGGQLAGHRARVMLGNGQGGFTSSAALDLTGASPADTEAADVNGDGATDVVSLDYYGGLSLFLSAGDGTFLPRVILAACTFNAGLAVADFNEDGYHDVAIGCRTSIFRDQIRLWMGTPAGLVEGPRLAVSSNYQTYAVRVGDINGDGNTDVALGSFDNQELTPTCLPLCPLTHKTDAIAYFLNLGQGIFEPVARHLVLEKDFYDFSIADTNQDGRGDIVAPMSTGTQFLIAHGKADGTLAAPTFIETYDHPEYFRVGDVTGDGIADIVSGHAAKILSVTPGIGGGAFGDPLSYAARLWVGEPPIADVDGDGDKDVLAGQYDGFELFRNGM